MKQRLFNNFKCHLISSCTKLNLLSRIFQSDSDESLNLVNPIEILRLKPLNDGSISIRHFNINLVLNTFSFVLQSESEESLNSLLKNVLFLFLVFISTFNSFAQKNIIEVDTSINYEKVILYACGEEIEILKGEDEYRIGECGIITSIKMIGKDYSFFNGINSTYIRNKGQQIKFFKKEDSIVLSVQVPINSYFPTGVPAQFENQRQYENQIK